MLSLTVFLIVLASVSNLVYADETVVVAWDYHLGPYQVSVEQPCTEPGHEGEDICHVEATSNQLIVEPIVVGSPAAKRDALPEPSMVHKRDSVIFYEYGYSGDRIYNGNSLEKILTMDAHPTNGKYYEITSNSSIYEEANRVVLTLRGCKIMANETWSGTFDPVTAVFHLFNSVGQQFLVNVTTGTCIPATPVRVGVSVVGAAYAVNNITNKYSLFVLDKTTNSFGALDPLTGAFQQLVVVRGRGVGNDSFDVRYERSELVVLFVQGNDFFRLNVATGTVSAPFNYEEYNAFQSFTFPAAQWKGSLTFTTPTRLTTPTATAMPTHRATTAPTPTHTHK